MTELQTKLLDMFKWFHNLCESEKLTYYAAGGSVLGAVRHGGFIPWDDDIDVIMPRPDYNRFIAAAQHESNQGRYSVEYPGSKRDYFYPYAKIYDTQTLLIENTRYKTPRGIYIDVFPLDGIGNTYEEAVHNFKKTERKRNLLLAGTCAFDKTKSAFRNISIIAGRCMFWVDNSKLAQSINDKCQKLAYPDCSYVANVMGAWHLKEIMQKEWLGSPVVYKFEDSEIFCPENCDAYLKRLYGDYMELPPIEKRVSHHKYLKIDLNRSYLK